MLDKTKILKARKEFEAYKVAHAKLYQKGWHKSIADEHTSLMLKLLEGLDEIGISSSESTIERKAADILGQFFSASEEWNMTQLGFADRDDFIKKANKAQWEALEAMPL